MRVLLIRKGLLDLLMYAAWDDEDFVSMDLAAHPDRGRKSDTTLPSSISFEYA